MSRTMFVEGSCPKCHKKIQVPDDSENIICMYCGAEILVAEAIGKKREVDSATYQENLEKVTEELGELIHSCSKPAQSFKKDRYEISFEEYSAKNQNMFRSMEEIYQTCQNREALIDEMVNALVDAAKKDLETYQLKTKRNHRQLDLNFMISIYLIPSVLNYPADFAEPFADTLLKTWNQEFQVTLGKAHYEDIIGGFRRKLCYITTAVCESLGKGLDCYELRILKNYRDQYLEKTMENHLLVEEYYNIAPTIVKRIDKQPDREKIYKELYQNYIQPCIHAIESYDYEVCKEHYKEMVLDLKERYLGMDEKEGTK